MWLTGLVAPRHVGSSQTRARTRVPCIGRQILNHCATREAPNILFTYHIESITFDLTMYFKRVIDNLNVSPVFNDQDAVKNKNTRSHVFFFFLLPISSSQTQNSANLKVLDLK